MLKRKLLKYLSRNRWSAVLKTLDKHVPKDTPELVDEWIQLKGQYHQLQDQQMTGKLSQADLTVEQNRMRQRFILFIEAFEATKKDAVDGEKKSIKWPFWLIFIGCLLLMGIGLLRFPSIEFELVGQTKFIAFRTAADLTLETDVYLRQFNSYTVKSFSADTVSVSSDPEIAEPLEVNLRDGRLKLNALDISAGTALDLSTDGSQINGQVYTDSLLIDLLLRKTTLDITNAYGESIVQAQEMPELLANVTLTEGPQFSFSETQDSLFVLQLLPISGLDFQRGNLNDDRTLKSEITAGTVVTRDIRHDLKEAPFVNLVGIDPSKTTLSLYRKGDAFQVKVRGQAKDLTIGSTSLNQSSVKPTIIAYLARSGDANQVWNWVMGILGFVTAVIGIWPRRK